MKIMLFPAVIAIGIAGCGSDVRGQGGREVQQQILAKGQLEMLPAETRIITNQSELEQVYARFVNAGMAPSIDFTTNEVIYVSIGQQASGGYDLDLIGINLVEVPDGASQALEYHLRTVVPRETCSQDTLITSPYVIASYRRDARFDGVVSFRSEVVASASCP